MTSSTVAMIKDRIFGGGGNDTLIGGTGDDELRWRPRQRRTRRAGDGSTFEGSAPGNNILHGDAGNDVLSGGIGHDILYGEHGQRCLYGNAVRNGGFGSVEGDLLDGGGGDDSVYGSDGNDTIFALDGKDYVRANGGDDSGNDQGCLRVGGSVSISAGLGYDTLHIIKGDVGGEATDLRFVFKFEALQLDAGVSVTLSDANGDAVRGPLAIGGGSFIDASAETGTRRSTTPQVRTPARSG